MPGATTWDDPLQKRAFALYLDGAVELGGPEVARIVECAGDRRVRSHPPRGPPGLANGEPGQALLPIVPDPARRQSAQAGRISAK